MAASFRDVDARFVPIVTWPGTPTRNRKRAKFRATWGNTLALMKRELKHLGAKNVVIQLDADVSQFRQDGYPRADARCGDGIILTLDSKYGPLSYPCDTYDNWGDNFRAIAMALEALRAVDRYGVTRRGEQYAGWAKLPGPVKATMTLGEAVACVGALAHGGALTHVRALAIKNSGDSYREAYRDATKVAHPDAGGSTEEFQRLQEAKRVLDKHHGLR